MGGGGSKDQTVGYRYYIGMHMVFAHGPIDAIRQIVVGDRRAWVGYSAGGGIYIDDPGLFGGESREGGVQGWVVFEPGHYRQARNDYLVSQLGGRVSAHRGVAGLVLRQCYIGNNPYLKDWAVLCERTRIRGVTGQAQWLPAYAAIGQDLNPSHIVRECLTDNTWGLGYNDDDMGSSFQDAAIQLYNEGFGLSYLWDRSVPIEDFVKEVIATIAGVLYVDRKTGKFELKLTRHDYNINNLPVFGEDVIISLKDFKRKSVADIVNCVTVKYWNRRILNNDSVSVTDIAAVSLMGQQVGVVVNYDGICTTELAMRVANRELRVLSRRIASCTIVVTRAAASLNVGDVFVLNWPRLQIDSVVMRVLEIEIGDYRSSQVTIKAAEDVFSFPESIVPVVSEPEWIEPNSPPAPVAAQYMYEANYYEIARREGDRAAEEVDDASGFAMIAACRPSQDAYNGILYSRVGSGESVPLDEQGPMHFVPYATLGAQLSVLATTAYIAGGVDLDRVEVGTWAFVGDEIVRVDEIDVDMGVIAIGRGCIDTVARPHASGEPVWFVGGMGASDYIDYAITVQPRYRIATVTSLGQLPSSLATETFITIQARHAKPYPPGRFRVNGTAYPSYIMGQIDISWAQRNRLYQTTAEILDESAGALTPEPGSGVCGAVYHANGTTVAAQFSGSTANSMAIALTAIGATGGIVIKLWSERGGIKSWQEHTLAIDYYGYGLRYGERYGW